MPRRRFVKRLEVGPDRNKMVCIVVWHQMTPAMETNQGMFSLRDRQEGRRSRGRCIIAAATPCLIWKMFLLLLLLLLSTTIVVLARYGSLVNPLQSEDAGSRVALDDGCIRRIIVQALDRYRVSR